MQAVLEKLYGYIIQYGINIIAALLIFIIGKWLARLFARLIESYLSKTKIDKTLVVFLRNIIYFGILTFVVIAALSKLGIETTSFVVIIGAAGFAVGLALQGSLSNFSAGVMLVIFKPFKVGDLIEAGGASGTVHEIQLFNTIVHTQDNKIIIVPNSKITSDKITIHKSA